MRFFEQGGMLLSEYVIGREKINAANFKPVPSIW